MADIIRKPNKKQQMGVAVVCELSADGTKITDDVLAVHLEQPCDGHHSLSVTIRHAGAARADSEFEDIGEFSSLVGKSVTLKLTPVGQVVDASRKLEFIGIITSVELQQAFGEINVVNIIAHSPTIALDAAPRSRVWEQAGSVNAMITGIIGDYAISQGRIASDQIPTASGSLNTEIESRIQYNETDYQFIKRVASDVGCFAYYDGKTFTVDKAQSSPMKETLKWRETLGSFKVGLGTAPMKFSAQVWDPVSKSAITGDVDSSALRVATSDLSRASINASDELYSTPGLAPAVKLASQAGVDQGLGRRVEASAGTMILCHGFSIVPGVSCGAQIRVDGLGDLDGDYWIRAVTHVVDDAGKYHNSFECTPTDLALPPQSAEVHPFRYIQSGIVTDNEDPENLGRIKVRLSWHRSDEESGYMRCLTFDGGQKRGWFALPEVGDEVLIAYERGNPDAPVVLGCMYNKKDTPPLASSDCLSGGAVSKKILRTRLGNEILLVDEDGKESITISQKDGNNTIVLTMDGPAVAIESKGDISLKGTNITLESTNGDIVLKSGAALKGSAQMDIEMKASGNFKSEGGMNHESKGGIALKGTGTQVTLEGSAMTTIKGALVKIN